MWEQYSTKDFLNLYGYFGIKTICIFIALKMDSSFRFINLGSWVLKKKKANTKPQPNQACSNISCVT